MLTGKQTIIITTNIPHLNQQLQPVSNTFDTNVSYSSLSTSNSYVESLFTFPLLVGAVGLLSILIFLIVLITRRCLECSKCIPPIIDEEVDNNSEEYQVLFQRFMFTYRILMACFWFSIAVVIIADHLQYYGNDELNSGITDATNSLQSLSNTFGDIYSTSVSMVSNSNVVLSLIEESGCTVATTGQYSLIPYTEDLISSCESLETTSQPVSNDIQNARSEIISYGINAKNYALYGVYAVVMIVTVGFIISSCVKSVLFTKLSIGCSVPIVIGLTIICTIEMIILMLMGDVCVDPTYNIVTTIPSGTVQNVLQYYSSCTGVNPFSVYIDNSTTYLHDLEESIYYFTTGPTAPCPGNTYLLDTEPYLNTLNTELSSVVNDTACPPILQLWNQAILTGVCDNMITGLFNLWLSQYCTSTGLFLTLCFASLLHQYYTRYRSMNDSNTDDNNDGIEMLPKLATASLRPSSAVFTADVKHMQTPSAPPIELRSSFNEYDVDAKRARSSLSSKSKPRFSAPSVHHPNEGMEMDDIYRHTMGSRDESHIYSSQKKSRASTSSRQSSSRPRGSKRSGV